MFHRAISKYHHTYQVIGLFIVGEPLTILSPRYVHNGIRSSRFSEMAEMLWEWTDNPPCLEIVDHCYTKLAFADMPKSTD